MSHLVNISLKHSKPHRCLSVIKTVRLAPFRQYQSKAGVFGFKAKEDNVNNTEEIGNALRSKYSHGKFYQLVNAYREHGHKVANINSYSSAKITELPEIHFEHFDTSLREAHDFSELLQSKRRINNVEEAIKYLHDAYCGTISTEFSYLENTEEREWFCKNYEEVVQRDVSRDDRVAIAKEMLRSQALDRFLATKFVSLKRYGCEGAESVMPAYMRLFSQAASDGVKNIVIGSHHRGRLNFLCGLLNMDPSLVFRKIQGKGEFPDGTDCIGDVLSHLCPISDISVSGRRLKVYMTNLPSHLEAVSPVSLGKTRCLQQLEKEAQYGESDHGEWGDTTINVQVHGDAAFMGQGVTQEGLLMSGLPHFEVGGSLHIIINNQLGFTTSPEYGRGTRYCTDIAKMISAPVIHVNGDDPEAVSKATALACSYLRRYRKNVFVDINCFRRWGHNELDDPTFTNPLIYQKIHSRKSVPDSYAEKLVSDGVVTSEELMSTEKAYSQYLNDCFKSLHNYNPQEPMVSDEWKRFQRAPHALTEWDTGVDVDTLHFVANKSVSFPEHFNIHPSLQKNHIKSRLSKLNDGTNIDWSTAESMAIGSLLLQGFNVRISGQDVGRGTFSHRHVMLVDQKSDEIYIPLNNMSPDQSGFLEVANSMLSEEAVLGFEYGFSSISPNNLVIWEAQFGDFCNGAQIQIDTYVTSGESKWMSRSGLVMLLPHGYDGAGPEHSSCRIERFLQLSDSSENSPDGEDVNIHIVNPTTPAQYFHLLRRQMIRNYRKPLIVVAPKLLLRSPAATSSVSQMSSQTSFSPVIGDSHSDASVVERIIFVSGKHYYALQEEKQKQSVQNVAIIRIEELSPFPLLQLQQELSKYKNAKEFVWSQEEPQNMGAWTFCRPRFENLMGIKMKYCGRNALASPAVGIAEVHRKEAEHVVKAPFGPL